MKAKNDHRSKFSNLSNWKEEAWKKSGLQRDSNPWPSSFQLLKLENLLRWSFFTFIYNRSSKMNYFIYTSHHFTPHGRYELNKLTSLPMCGFIAQLVEQRTGNAEVTGSNPVEALTFCRLLLSNCLNWKIHCDDHSSLFISPLVLIQAKIQKTTIRAQFRKQQPNSWTHFSSEKQQTSSSLSSFDAKLCSCVRL